MSAVTGCHWLSLDAACPSTGMRKQGLALARDPYLTVALTAELGLCLREGEGGAQRADPLVALEGGLLIAGRAEDC